MYSARLVSAIDSSVKHTECTNGRITVGSLLLSLRRLPTCTSRLRDNLRPHQHHGARLHTSLWALDNGLSPNRGQYIASLMILPLFLTMIATIPLTIRRRPRARGSEDGNDVYRLYDLGTEHANGITEAVSCPRIVVKRYLPPKSQVIHRIVQVLPYACSRGWVFRRRYAVYERIERLQPANASSIDI
jgi:hypothetical protein